jgi:hypothetical protein
MELRTIIHFAQLQIQYNYSQYFVEEIKRILPNYASKVISFSFAGKDFMFRVVKKVKLVPTEELQWNDPDLFQAIKQSFFTYLNEFGRHLRYSVSLQNDLSLRQYTKYGDEIVNNLIRGTLTKQMLVGIFKLWKEEFVEKAQRFQNSLQLMTRSQTAAYTAENLPKFLLKECSFPLLKEYVVAGGMDATDMSVVSQLNMSLIDRVDVVSDEDFEMWKRLAENMKQYIQEKILGAPTFTLPIIVFRGLTKRLQRVSRATFTSFTSTSYNVGQAAFFSFDSDGDFLMIKLQPGSHCLCMNYISTRSGEDEILLPSGCKLEASEEVFQFGVDYIREVRGKTRFMKALC